MNLPLRSVLRAGFVIILVIFQQCSSQPESLLYGKDVCHFCKMTLVDNKFGAELVTKKGKVYKFDDINCMLNFYHSGYEEIENFEHKLIVNYERPGVLLNADEAYYLKSDEIRSPMASEVAAFESYDRAMFHKRKWGGIYLAWGEVLTQFK